MSSKLAYNTSDVFTTTPYTGNQVAIVHVPSGTNLSQSQKQTITIEFNYSETVFLHQKTSTSTIPTYDAQIFTPKSELPFAGHPTIGTAVYIFTNLEIDVDEIIINLKAGPVKATFDRKTGRAKCEIPQEAHVHAAQISNMKVGAVQAPLNDSDRLKNVTVDVASIVRGMNFALINMSSNPEDLAHVGVTKDNVITKDVLDEDWPSTLLGDVFYYLKPDQGDNTIRVRQRVIVIELEDPATGAASGALTSFLALQRGEGGKTYQFELEQGVEMGRRSIIGAEVTLSADGKKVEKVALMGDAVEVMEGRLKY